MAKPRKEKIGARGSGREREDLQRYSERGRSNPNDSWGGLREEKISEVSERKE